MVARVVWIWDVKHGGGDAEADGKAQVDNFIKALQKKLGSGFRVQPGYKLDPRLKVNRSNPKELITVESKVEEPGVELYDYGSDDPYSVKLRGLRNSTFGKQVKDEPMSLPTLDPKTTGQTAGGAGGSGLRGVRDLEGNTGGDGAGMTGGMSAADEATRLKSVRGIRVELDYLLPGGSAEVGPRVVDWFTVAVERLAGEFMAQLPAGGLPSKGLRDPAGGPFGPVGSRWCSLLVIGQGERRLSKSLRAWSPKNWERFLSQAADVSVEMSAKFSTLNRFGHAGVPSLTISAYRERRPEARQWLRLDATYVVGMLGETAPIPDEVPEAWREFLLTQCERWPAVFGFLADDAISAGTRTPLEARRATFPDDTLPLSDSQVRGYSWVTVTSAGVLQRLGGIEAVRRSGAFASAIELLSSGAVLQATPRLSEYEGDAVRKVFEALAPVLPADAPWPDAFNRFRLIYEAPRR